MFLQKKRAKKSPKHTDHSNNEVFFDHARGIISLKPRTVTIQVDRRRVLADWRALRTHKGILAAVFALFFMVSIVGFARYTRAEVNLYPHSCLGGWNNTSKAQDQPELDGSDPSKYDNTNSASVSNTLAEMYCGGFEGDIPKDTAPKTISVHISWALRANKPAVITGDSFASSTSEIIDATTSTSFTATTSSSSDSASSTVPASSDEVPKDMSAPTPPVENPAPVQIDTPVSSPAPADSAPVVVPDTTPPAVPTDPQSMINGVKDFFAKNLVSFAYAQEATSTLDMATSSAGSDLARVTSASTSESTVTEDAILEVSYTLDGTTWQILGTVTRSHLVDTSFNIPLDSIHNWDDVSKLQIRVRSLSGLLSSDTVYVDGMLLAVGYSMDAKHDIPQGDQNPKSFHVSVLPHGGTKLSAKVVDDDTGQQEFIFKGIPGTGFKVFKLEDPSFGLTSSFGDDPMTMLTSDFKDGDFVMIDTRDPSECTNLGLAECRATSGYIDELSFSVTLYNSLNTSESTTSSDATIPQ